MPEMQLPEGKPRSHWTPERTIGALAVFVASLALLVSLDAGRQARRHNRLSVRPFMSVEFHSEPDAPQGIFLVNHGVGPAVFGRTELFMDGAPIAEGQRTPWRALQDTLFRYLPPGSVELQTTATAGPGTVLAARDHIVSCGVVIGGAYGARRLFTPELLSRIGVKLKYFSLYGEPFLAVAGNVKMSVDERALLPKAYQEAFDEQRSDDPSRSN
jgi:hypothetical protein